MKKHLLLLACGLIIEVAHAADTLTLSRCWELFEAAGPLSANTLLIDESLRLKLAALTARYYPRLAVTAQASYQSDVTSIDLSAAPFPLAIDMPTNDQYKVALDIEQILYDAGQTAHSKRLERLNSREAALRLQADRQGVKRQIAQIYFAGLIYQAQRQIIALQIATLAENIRKATSAVTNGALQPRDLHLLQVEKLRAEQQLAEAGELFAACLQMLASLTRMAFAEAPVLVAPVPPPAPDTEIVSRRPELAAFDIQQERLLATGDLLESELLPRVALFGQAGYGRPALNMLSPGFDPYYIAGVRLSWTPWNWGQTQKERSIRKTQARMAANHKAAFDDQLQTQAADARHALQAARSAVQHDAQIIALRERITAESASQLANGVLTASDYIADLNAQTIARINHEIHRIKMIKAQIDLSLIMNYEL
ncbi:MAG: TolC family protein [Prevotellaceae bacterium]|jgi:outer membrane protein TolC|nr:TolC family protein [Prevotellaceae bacterium]